MVRSIHVPSIAFARHDHDIATITPDIQFVLACAVPDQRITHRIQIVRSSSRRCLLERSTADSPAIHPLDTLITVCIDHYKVNTSDRCPVSLRILFVPMLNLIMRRLYLLVMLPLNPRSLSPSSLYFLFRIKGMARSKVFRRNL